MFGQAAFEIGDDEVLELSAGDHHEHTEHVKPGIGNDEGESDEWPLILEKVKRCNIIVPPNTDLYWVGDAGPGASYIEAGGDMSPYVRRNAELTAINLLRMAKVLQDNPYDISIKEHNATIIPNPAVDRACCRSDGLRSIFRFEFTPWRGADWAV